MASWLLLLVSLGAGGPVADGGPAPSLESLRRDLQLAALAMEPCSQLRELLAAANARLDAQPGGEDFALLGEILRVSAQAGCAAPRGAEARHAADAAAAFAQAKRLSHGKSQGGGGPSWNGTLLQNAGEERLARARAALRAGDLFAARRELVLLHADAVQAAMALVDPPAEAAVRREIDEREPRRKPGRAAATPEEAIRSLERAAIALDRPGFLALLVPRSVQRAALEGEASDDVCAQYRDDPSVALPCLLLELLPEAPAQVVCRQEQPGERASCAVVGREGRRLVQVVHGKRAWQVESSSPGD